MKKTILFSVVALTVALATFSYSATSDNPNYTLISDTVIVTYYDASSGGNKSDTTSTYDTRVALIVGCTVAHYSITISGPRSSYKSETFTIYNTGNSNDSFTIYVSPYVYAGGSDSWYAYIVDGSETVADNNSNDATYSETGSISSLIGEDATRICTVTVWINNNAVKSPNGSSAYCTVVVQSDTFANAVKIAQYTGDNSVVYAEGAYFADDTIAVTLKYPLLVASKTGSCTMAGAVSLPVPGAQIIYALTHSNDGNDSAYNVVIVDKVDTNYVSFSTLTETAANWVVYFTKNQGADTDTYVGLEDGDWKLSFDDGAVGGKANVAWVKWEKAQVGEAEDSQVNRFNVFIK